MWHKKLFSPRHLPLMAQDDRGALQRDCPTGPADCYHLGYLEEIPLSVITLDTCYGDLEGIMKLDDLTYEIKPLMCSERDRAPRQRLRQRCVLCITGRLYWGEPSALLLARCPADLNCSFSGESFRLTGATWARKC
ncbi:hypothetical protein R6Z07F_010716 [Ovis aries]